jgi:hypothetical protein
MMNRFKPSKPVFFPIFPALLGSVSTNFIVEVVCLQMVGAGGSQYFSAFVF